MKVIINLGKGNLHDGCDHIVVQLFDRDSSYWRQVTGSLPPAAELAELHRKWQANYRFFYQEKVTRIGLLEPEGFRYSENEFKQICQQITRRLNQWLEEEGFVAIEKVLRTDLDKAAVIQIIITAEDKQLKQLPWHLWQFLDDYTLAEVAVNSPNWQKINSPSNRNQKVKILSILGNSEGLDVREDLKALANLSPTEVTILTEPKLSELNEHLWQKPGWDILLFSGHSYSDLKSGYIYLNAREKITIAQLKHSLNKAISGGLQIAIFNSCEGVGLALELADLSIPYTVVMGEPVPDKIAQLFLEYFINAFAGGKTFTLAVKEARQKLAGWEAEFVCASWLPIIWQNPTINSLTWKDLIFQSSPKLYNRRHDDLQQLQYASKSRKSYFFQRQKLWKKALLIGLISTSSLAIARYFSWLEFAELWAYDRLLQQRPAETIDPRILVVEITEEDTNRESYPLSDTTLVKAIDTLIANRPAAIGVDIHRPYARGEDYQELVNLLEKNSNVFPICAYSSENNSYNPPQGLSEIKLREQMGFSDLAIDGDFSNPIADKLKLSPTPKVRRQLLSYDPSLAASPSSCLTPYSLSFQLAFEYLQRSQVEPLQVTEGQEWQFGEVIFSEMGDKFGGYQQLTANTSQIPIAYRTQQPGQKITLTELLSGRANPQLIRDRIIFIGYTAAVARDYFDTPYGIMPGVWIHAHMTSQIISAVMDGRSLIWVLPQWGDWLWILIWSTIAGILLLLLSQKHKLYSWSIVFILILVIDRVCLLFLMKGGWLPYVPTILSLLLTAIIITTFMTRENFLIQPEKKI